MTRANRQQWSYSTGERGRNRVRAFAHPVTGRMFLEFSDRGRRTRIALGHRESEAAKAKAEELATALRRGVVPSGHRLKLGTLFDIYVREVTPRKSRSVQGHDRFAARLFLQFLGSDREARTLNRRDWDRFIEWRRDRGDKRGGRVRGSPLRNRTIDYDLEFLRAVLNWAAAARDEQGEPMLDRNPLKGMPRPKDDEPRRPLLADEQYETMLRVSRKVSPLFDLALVLARETGHRLGAVISLRWSDIDLERGVVHWRGQNDKIGFDHETPLTPAAIAVLQRARAERPSIGDAWVFAAVTDSSRQSSRHIFRQWWRQAERLAGITHEAGLGWHSLRRAFATALKHAPLRDLCELGGWKNAQTILKSYQQADHATMRQALATRQRTVRAKPA